MKKKVKVICNVDVCSATATLVTLRKTTQKAFRILRIKKVSIAAK